MSPCRRWRLMQAPPTGFCPRPWWSLRRSVRVGRRLAHDFCADIGWLPGACRIQGERLHHDGPGRRRNRALKRRRRALPVPWSAAARTHRRMSPSCPRDGPPNTAWSSCCAASRCDSSSSATDADQQTNYLSELLVCARQAASRRRCDPVRGLPGLRGRDKGR
jgi:hypothetical protein